MGEGGLGNEGVPELGEPGVGKDGVGNDDCEPLFGWGIGFPDGCPDEEEEVGLPVEDCGDGNWMSGKVEGTLDMHPLSPKIAITKTTTLAPKTNSKNRRKKELMNFKLPYSSRVSIRLSMF
ncbi:MAG: hypothetical protein F4W92_07885 [Gammaproteobacteria bacterium]|nr:hypothetical protein [Gammaproteobacteria bacterium]